MRIYCLQNDPLAGLGAIETWISKNAYSVTTTHVYNDSNFLSTDEYDLLIILGGPMGAYEEEQYPWLQLEKEYISEAIRKEKFVFGICLGAQLIASALGSPVYPHTLQEIGWWQLERTKERESLQLFNGLPEKFTVFELHGDTFDLPEGAVRIAESKACLNQAFMFENYVIGLQFHPEFTENTLNNVVEKIGHELTGGAFIQKPEEFLNRLDLHKGAHSILFNLLDNICESIEIK
ncbi:type 1 glutamine amidotransferase [Solibacillus sp. MA9]|uniref:Type 1 glutamine amidotransferase n=1 Tax=Solibacillus palustris TaxID=2908203 RepID=A0ABS9UBV1_9BACL|nr:type 1 glutamine amidotransferase [Solibacillus sp. MA9]MCH7321639.1 type 1 glutamine amidotransferase [Solibacillus sp. MA9]